MIDTLSECNILHKRVCKFFCVNGNYIENVSCFFL